MHLAHSWAQSKVSTNCNQLIGFWSQIDFHWSTEFTGGLINLWEEKTLSRYCSHKKKLSLILNVWFVPEQTSCLAASLRNVEAADLILCYRNCLPNKKSPLFVLPMIHSWLHVDPALLPRHKQVNKWKQANPYLLKRQDQQAKLQNPFFKPDTILGHNSWQGLLWEWSRHLIVDKMLKNTQTFWSQPLSHSHCLCQLCFFQVNGSTLLLLHFSLISAIVKSSIAIA